MNVITARPGSLRGAAAGGWLSALLLAAPAPAQVPDDAVVPAAMAALGVPGVAVAVVQDGRVVLTRGYGVRRAGHGEPVDEHTRFGIGSNTKAMTAALAAMLVDEGRLGWDDPVIRHLPGFALADPQATREVTIRDLLAHRTGLARGAGDLLAFPASTHSSAEILGRVRHLPLHGPLRSGFRYNNMNYLAAGAVIHALTGATWEENLRARILDPLGMEDAAVSAAEYDPDGNWAAPHLRIAGLLTAVGPAVFDNAAPAGSVHASAADLARWMIAVVDSGTGGGERLWSPARAAEMWTIQAPIPPGAPPPGLSAWGTPTLGYGLGFLLREYRGELLAYHSGEVPGYFSHLYLVPARRVGVAVLTNAETPASHAIAMTLLDQLLGAPSSDWLGAMSTLAAADDSAEVAAERALAARRDASRESSLPLPRYAARYADEWYGEVEVVNAGTGLQIRFAHTPALVGEMEHWAGDTFRVRWQDPGVPDALATFTVSGTAVSELRLERASPTAHFRYSFQDLRLRPVAR